MAEVSMQRILAALRTTLYTSAFIAFFLVYLPWTLAIRGRAVSYDGLGALRWLAVVPLAAGAYVALSCVAAFAWRGLGTPAPFDPPRRLVIHSQSYRWYDVPCSVRSA